MKLVKSHKGFKIKEITDKEKLEWGWTSKYKIFNRDNEEEWDCDSIEEAIEWIDCY